MILNRLYEFALREALLDDPAFESLPVPFVIHLAANGDFQRVEERRGDVVTPSKKKGAPPKTKPDKGIEIPVPKAHGNTANKGFARYFVDTLPRVLPMNDDAKSAASRATFWEQVANAARETSDAALEAVSAFGCQLAADSDLAARVRAEVEALKPAAGDRCTLAWSPDEGRTIMGRDVVRAWYRGFFAGVSAERQEASDQGYCQITGEYGPLARSHSTKIVGVPNGLPAGVSVVSFDKPAFESYGLDGAVNAGIGYRAADGYTRALNALLADKWPSGRRSCLKSGGVAFLFWTRAAEQDDFWTLLERPDSGDVRRLLGSVDSGQQSHGISSNDFYMLCISGNAARAVVRDYLEQPLVAAKEHLRRWFDDLRIVDHFSSEVRADFPVWMLANSTIRTGDALPPAVLPALVRAALAGAAVGENILAACLRRMRVETGSAQFSPARMALTKLVLNRLPHSGDLKMTETLDETAGDRSLGYACGRLLALLARCQAGALGQKDYGASAPILERYYGAASTTPRSIFAVLLRLNRHHLRKVRDENPGFAYNLEQEIERRLDCFRGSADSDPDFPALLSLPEQGRFALGFYQQRAAYRAATLDRRAAEQAAAEQVAG